MTSTQAQTETVPVGVVWLNGTVTCPNISLSSLINDYQNSQSKPTVEVNKVFSHTFFSMSYYGLPVTKTVPDNGVPTPPSDVLPLPTKGPRYYGPHVAIAQGNPNLLVGLGPPANSITLTLDPGCDAAAGCNPVHLTVAATPISSTQIHQQMSFSIGTSAAISHSFYITANEYLGTYMGLRDDKAIKDDAPCPSLKHCILLAIYLPGDRAAEQMLKHDPPIQLMGKSMTLTITAYNSILGDVVIDPRGGSLP